MLTSLQLVGFKSFADKTEFTFPAGLTAIVGPNGSGKSNIVDAVRWVLGEQSAKSLRGGEMADVIFNGSTSRKSFGMAEVTMTFDNSRRQLATDAEEVQITRRVYRNGEGEYLINQQISRLKDIKNLFLGSGAGADAYSIIEQGRVDVMLQSSTQERRVIFEEAAGISRFKAKKTETLRKLERVDQNVQRLKDIIDEVEKQLRSVKLQAAKALRYQEYSGRLKELRVGLSLCEYHELAGKLSAETAQLDRLRAALAEQAAQAETSEAAARRLEEALARLEETAHEQEAALAGARQQIAAHEATLSHEWSLSSDLDADLARTRAHLTELNFRVATLTQSAVKVTEELQAVEVQCGGQRQSVQTLEAELTSAAQRLTELRQQAEDAKEAHLEQMRQTARLQNDAVSCKAQVDNLRRERERLRLKTEQAAEHLASLDIELQGLTTADESLQACLGTARRTLTDRRQERDRLRQLHDATQQLAADLRAQRSGLASRIEVLEGLERSHEGLGTGVREVKEALQIERGQAASCKLQAAIIGMVADFLTVRREYAPLIDLALGELAQRFLVRDPALLIQALEQRNQPFSGRVSFLPLPVAPQPETEEDELPAVDGLIAFAAPLVTCEYPGLTGLPGHFLGHTLIVRDLAAARRIQEWTRTEQQRTTYRFITLQGEVLEADGTLTVGTHHAEAGILSRKSELRELREQAAGLDRRLVTTEQELTGLRERMAALDRQAEQLQQEINVLAEQAADLRSRIGQHRQRREGLHEEVAISQTEISGIDQEIHGLEDAWQRAQSQAEEAERQVQVLQTQFQQAEQEIREREQQREQREQECTAAKVALAQAEERLSGQRAKHRQIESDLEQRRQERAQSEQHLTAARTRLEESQRIMLQATSALARCYLEKEAAERRLAELGQERDRQRLERQRLAERAHAARGAWQAQQEQAHAHELAVNDLRHRRDTLVERLREDYQLDLAELYTSTFRETQAAPQAEDVAAVNEEIAELRRKLSRLGSVNLDSLQELAELETRAQSLQVQYDDLTAAKRSLEEIIAKINQDSRRLFEETFNAIRTHFQELFRKLFGGGMADIVLEDPSDILESGIEIVARPPGKELRSISLMSGGEKTMTAVALLMAIFRNKPSPFCILDEVDAALDEANISRFTAVLREFLDRSQFILITHSKRTMASADVLYGITMQESGISKRVAVRFEDWSANGDGQNGQPAATLESAAVATRNGD